MKISNQMAFPGKLLNLDKKNYVLRVLHFFVQAWQLVRKLH